MVIGGSTASGKSALALEIARRAGGVIVNADSQQLFADLAILSARPGPADLELAEHELYGILEARAQPSVALWLDALEPVIARCMTEGKPVILTGGTGLYLHGLLHGIAPMPSIDPEIRAALRAWAGTVPAPAIHARLAGTDPVMAARLRPPDRQRCLRALEVILSTGRSLSEFQAQTVRRVNLEDSVVRGLALVPPAALLRERIARRLQAMLDAGAQAEVDALLARVPDATGLPIAKLHGMRELAAVARGQMTLADAFERITAQVRQYAKRQRTWFRHQLPELTLIEGLGEEPQTALRARTVLNLG